MMYREVEQSFFIQDGELWRYTNKGNHKVSCDKYQTVMLDGVVHKYQNILYALYHKVSLRDSVKVGYNDGDDYNKSVTNLYVIRKKYTYK